MLARGCSDVINRWLNRLDAWPVIHRELREGARLPVNHRLRFWSGLVGTLLLWFIVANSDDSVQVLGGRLLGGLHGMLLGLILLIVPGLTADCIARERREGTLGLLFLTPLRAGGIITGKAVVQALRAITLWLAVLPLLTIPFLTGGINWFDAFSALSLEFCATVLCLGAGLLASSLVRERNTVFLLSLGFAALFLLLFSQSFLLILIVGWRGLAGLKGFQWWDLSLQSFRIFTGNFEAGGGPAAWSSFGIFSPVLAGIWKRLCWGGPAVAMFAFFAIHRFAAARLKRSWQDSVPSARREKLRQRYCTPIFSRLSRRLAQRSLDFNPIAWLQQCSWKTRASKWFLFLAFLLVGSAACALADDDREFVLFLLLLTLGGFYVFVGVSSFLKEKRSGALEILLVTPLSAGKIIFGRTWGLWKQFLPAGLVLAVLYLNLHWTMYLENQDATAALQWLLMLASGFLVLPVFATYFALRVKGLPVAAALTSIAVCVPPLFAWEAAQTLANGPPVSTRILPLLIVVSTGIFAYLACRLLRHSLSRRIYSF